MKELHDLRNRIKELDYMLTLPLRFYSLSTVLRDIAEDLLVIIDELELKCH